MDKITEIIIFALIVFIVAIVIYLVNRFKSNKQKETVATAPLPSNYTNVIKFDEKSKNNEYYLKPEESDSTVIIFTQGLKRANQKKVIYLPEIANNMVSGLKYKIMVFDDPSDPGASNGVLSVFPNSPSPISITQMPQFQNRADNLLGITGDQATLSLDNLFRSFYIVAHRGMWYVSI